MPEMPARARETLSTAANTRAPFASPAEPSRALLLRAGTPEFEGRRLPELLRCGGGLELRAPLLPLGALGGVLLRGGAAEGFGGSARWPTDSPDDGPAWLAISLGRCSIGIEAEITIEDDGISSSLSDSGVASGGISAFKTSAAGAASSSCSSSAAINCSRASVTSASSLRKAALTRTSVCRSAFGPSKTAATCWFNLAFFSSSLSCSLSASSAAMSCEGKSAEAFASPMAAAWAEASLTLSSASCNFLLNFSFVSVSFSTIESWPPTSLRRSRNCLFASSKYARRTLRSSFSLSFFLSDSLTSSTYSERA
mmetsp:Transcript_118347/g.209161  ORF Transcript_118347/g.209161 Transcript_118347/m.209161 type:complete len:311 (+) Transcript_118347:128-1060(+)